MKIYTNINENIPNNCVATIGFFDGLHLGHKFLLEQVKEQAISKGRQELIISLWPHPSYLFNRPIKLLSTYKEKIALFQKLGVQNLLMLNFTDEISKMSRVEFTNQILIEKLKISELVIGFNNSFGKKEEIKEDYDLAIPVNTLNRYYLEGNIEVNSSIIRQMLNLGQIENANNLLNYKYTLSGTVVSGYQIGRKIGFPTANIGNIDETKLIPANGVYICQVLIEGSTYPAMLNIGNRPSFNGNALSMEFHIPDFDANLYNKEITIEFIKKIRDEKKFENIDNLVIQLQKDKETTLAYFR